MEARELRIGNLFRDAHGRVCEVEQVSKDFEDCRIYARNYAITKHPINPIPLTEEILLKCGFEKDELGAFIIRPVEFGKPYVINGISDLGWSFELSTEEDWAAIVRVYSLHQLQNLYFG